MSQELEAECLRCNGEGEDPGRVLCEDCAGAGWIKCGRGGVGCPFAHCYCEAAWERQEESKAEWG